MSRPRLETGLETSEMRLWQEDLMLMYRQRTEFLSPPAIHPSAHPSLHSSSSSSSPPPPPPPPPPPSRGVPSFWPATGMPGWPSVLLFFSVGSPASQAGDASAVGSAVHGWCAARVWGQATTLVSLVGQLLHLHASTSALRAPYNYLHHSCSALVFFAFRRAP